MSKKLMTYRQAFKGDIVLREELVKYLSETRSISVSVDNIMITRGSIMAFYLLYQAILEAGDKVAVGYPGFNEGYATIGQAKGQVRFVPVDEEGLNIAALEALCQRETIKAVFVISHHHYPTTVSLSARRRMDLLVLAEKYNLAVIEDDYDYDFHYSSSPLLPIASYDLKGHVAYVGSFSKVLAPSLRVGFIVAPEDVIEKVSGLSRSIDSYGNTATERAIAMLFQSGEINRHLKKALKVYRERRNIFCELLQSQISRDATFNVPEGGLSVWVTFEKDTCKYEEFSKRCLTHKIQLVPTVNYAVPTYPNVFGTRIGFASRSHEDWKKLIDRLSHVF